MKTFAEELELVFRAGRPLVAVTSADESRLERIVGGVAAQRGLEVVYWDCVAGTRGGADNDCDAAVLLRGLIESVADQVVVVYDLGGRLGDVSIQRLLKAYYQKRLGRSGCLILVLGESDSCPMALEAVMPTIKVPPPSTDELRAYLDELGDLVPEMSDEDRGRVELACRGVALSDVRHLLKAAGEDPSGLTDGIFREKARMTGRAGGLQYVDVSERELDVGGLSALQEWIDRRGILFGEEQVASGAPVPKGILIMGVSGCGKSLCAKAVAHRWHLPLFRLDLNLVFSGVYGSAEAAFHQALQAVEAAAPAVLWIDEIENGFGLTGGGDGSSDAQLFSSFLTWMQEKPPLVFVAATANRIESLPAEMIRKGRFDQVFFCDLPDEEDRKSVIRIHLERNGANMDDFDIDYLAISTEEWSGAEIEQAIVAARVDAMRDGGSFRTEDVTRHTREMVPLSETMREQIKALRSWAWNRATPASGKRRRM